MQVIRGYEGVSPEQRGAAAALGNFDGVHKGHQVLIAEATRVAGAMEDGRAPVGVITFEPHPRRYFQPEAPGFRLTTSAERARVLARLGVDRVYELGFDKALATMSAEGFAETVLCRGLGLRHVVIGEDFRFGKGRTGTAALLRDYGRHCGFGVSIQHMLRGTRGEFSSTGLRVLIEQGLCAEAAEQLGRWHTVSGRVIEGDKRGRDLGFPTANLAFGEQLVPCHGIYAVEVTVHDGRHAGCHQGVASIGERPTFGAGAANFEVYLFDFSGDLYGAEISAGLVSYLRPEVKFDGIDALVAQMAQDCTAARAALASATVPA